MNGMATMDEHRLREHVLERLVDGGNPDEIIFEICNSMDMNWREAEAFVNHIQAENQGHITLQQSPLLVMLALVIFLGGAGLTVYSVSGVVATFETFRVTSSNDLYGLPQGIVFIWYMASYTPELIGSLIFGMGMIVGSLKGMQGVWEAVFEKLGMFEHRE